MSTRRLLLIVLLPALALAACGGDDPRGVILIGVDTLRADHLGLYGASRPTSPFLDELAAGGAVFEHAFATSPWTLPSFASIFTGRLQSGHAAGILLSNSDEEWDPNRIGLHERVMLDPAAETLAEALRGAGFETIAVAQNPNLDPAFGVDRGFTVYDYRQGSYDDKRRADVVVDLAFEHLDSRTGEDFFLFLHFFDPHMQYDAPAPYGGMFTGGLDGGFTLPVAEDPRELDRDAENLSQARKEFISAAYDEEIRFLDSQLERLVDGLRERGLWDTSLVIFTSDHGEELFEHDGFEHGHTVYNEVIGVPLIVWGPGVTPGRGVVPVSIADIMPTTLDALGMVPPDGIFGTSLWPYLHDGDDLSSRLIVAEGVLYGSEKKTGILWPHKIIVDPEDNRVELFDLEADFGESSPLPAGTDTAQRLLDLLELRLLASRQGVTYEQIELDPELRRRLRSLGYIR